MQGEDFPEKASKMPLRHYGTVLILLTTISLKMRVSKEGQGKKTRSQKYIDFTNVKLCGPLFWGLSSPRERRGGSIQRGELGNAKRSWGKNS